MRTTWFVISPHLAAVNQAQSTKTQLFGPGSLGLCAKEKSTLTFWRLRWGLGKRRGKKQSLRKHGSKARKHLEEGKFLLVHSTSRSQKCGFLQRTFYRGTLYGILGNFPAQDKFYATFFFSILYFEHNGLKSMVFKWIAFTMLHESNRSRHLFYTI